MKIDHDSLASDAMLQLCHLYHDVAELHNCQPFCDYDIANKAVSDIRMAIIEGIYNIAIDYYRNENEEKK